jgi:hypothetical protein
MSELLRLKKEFERVHEIYQKYLPTEEEGKDASSVIF